MQIMKMNKKPITRCDASGRAVLRAYVVGRAALMLLVMLIATAQLLAQTPVIIRNIHSVNNLKIINKK